MIVSRRAVLIGGTAAVLAACGSDGSADAETGAFVSQRRGGVRTGWTLLYPPGHESRRPWAGLPVLVALHGRGADHAYPHRTLHLDRVLARTVAAGTRPFAIASVDGGDHDYWHPRRNTDPAGMVIDEFLPLLAHRGLDTRRVGFLGWSMGGYGALYLAGVLGRRRCAVAVAASAAIWHQSRQVAEGSFDGAADFRAHALWGRIRSLSGIALRIDCGAGDGFAPVIRDLRSRIEPTPAGGIEPGGHNSDYWRSQAPAELAFAGRFLA
jgi:enterochelin esterase-like enzyme